MGNAVPQLALPELNLSSTRQSREELSTGMSLDQLNLFAFKRPRAIGTHLLKPSKLWEITTAVFFGTSTGQYAFLSLIAVVLLIVGTFVWRLGSDGTTDFDTSLDHSIWLSYTTFIDTGTQTGVPAGESERTKFIVVVLSGLGFVFNLTFLSVVVDNVRTLLDRLYTRYSQLFAREHVVILGWTSKTLFLVDELISMFADNGGKGDIIIMGNTSRYEMLRSIELTFRRRNPPKPRGVRIRVWEGDSAEEDDLTRLSINTARFVVCLAESEDPRMADAQVLETLLSLQSLDDDDQVTGQMIAEVRTPDGRDVVNQLNKHTTRDVLAVQSAAALDKVLAFTALMPSVGESLVELISFERNNFFFEPADSRMVGKTFGNLVARFPYCVLCGVHSRPLGADGKTKGSEIVIAPSADRVIQPNDRILLVGVDSQSAIVVNESGVPGGRVKVSHRARHHLSRLVWALHVFRQRRRQARRLREKEDTRSRARPSVADGAIEGALEALRAAREFELRQTVLVIGWRSAREMADLVAVLSKMLLPGSEIHFLSAVDESVREAALRSEMDIFAALTDLAGGILNNAVSIEHHKGSPLSAEAYNRLPIDDAAVAIVFGDRAAAANAEELTSYSESAARLRDARTFHVTTLLRKKAPDLRIVPVYEDILTHRLITRDSPLVVNDGIGAGETAVLHRNSLETGLIAMQADDPTLVFVFSQLLALDAGERKIFSTSFEKAWLELGQLKLGQSVAELEPLSFYDVSLAIHARQGHVVLGYRSAEEGEMIVNPEKKEAPRKWSAYDELVMLRAQGAVHEGRAARKSFAGTRG